MKTTEADRKAAEAALAGNEEACQCRDCKRYVARIFAEAMQPEREAAAGLAEDMKTMVRETQDDLCGVMNDRDCPEDIQMALGPIVASMHNWLSKALATYEESQT